jgi:hypothetical protein
MIQHKLKIKNIQVDSGPPSHKLHTLHKETRTHPSDRVRGYVRIDTWLPTHTRAASYLHMMPRCPTLAGCGWESRLAVCLMRIRPPTVATKLDPVVAGPCGAMHALRSTVLVVYSELIGKGRG